MDILTQYDPKVIEALVKLAATVFAVFSGLATAIWAIVRFLDDKRKEREEKSLLEQKRLIQQQIDEQGRRSERVASLMSEFGATDDPQVRGWITLALSMYPHETVRLLSMSLSQFNDETATAVRLALVNIGAPALPELIKLNRIAWLSKDIEGKPSAEDQPELNNEQERLLKRTQIAIVQLLFYIDRESILAQDLSELDLSDCNFQGLKLEGISLRKCQLSGSNFKNTSIKKSNFRGALVDKAFFVKASLNEADFTGAKGSINAIKSYADDAKFHYATLQNSQFDGASLVRSDFLSANLDKSSICGAQLHHSVIDKTHFNRLNAQKIKAKSLKCTGSEFVSTNLDGSNISNSIFERCKMMGMSAKNLKATAVKFHNCNLGGIDFNGSNLTGSEFLGCILGGTDFRGCNLSGVTFHKCQLETALFDDDVEITG